MRIEGFNLEHHLPLIFSILLVGILLLMPTGFEDAVIYKGADRSRASVVSVDDSFIIDTGLIRSGEQLCIVEIKQGQYAGEITEAINMLSGSMEADKIFKPGDEAFVLISHQNGKIGTVTMIDHYRINKEIVLAIFFVVFLVFFAQGTGVRAVISFVITILAIWKLLIPSYLAGYNPIYIGLTITVLLTALILSLVYGFNKKALAAILGSLLGVISTCILGIFCTDSFQLHGTVMSGSESLLYSGFQYLNLTGIFMASIFIGSSGAIMDLAVDITSSVHEVIEKKPEMHWKEAVQSGMNIGRAVMGTMTTTLLLAYSGGYLAMLMVFMAQGTPILNILNYKYIAAEIAHTVVGSFGLVLVAPFTALTSGILLTQSSKESKENNMV